MSDDINIEVSDEEVEYLVLLYLKEQLEEGREFIQLREIFEYFECEWDDEVDEDMLIHIKELFEYMGCEWDKELDGDFMIHLTDEGQNVMSIIAHDKKKLH